jgi:hypothetical protein
MKKFIRAWQQRQFLMQKKERYGYPKASEYLFLQKKMPGLWHKRILRFSLYIQNLKA